MPRAVGSVLLALAVAACRTAAAPVPPPPPAPPEMSDSLHWVRNSAEYRAIALETYRLAAGQIQRAAQGRPAGSWAVVLDADETVLDNSSYEKELLQQGVTHTPERWSAWVARKAAPAVPGAVAFIRGVKDLGGRVAIVSNRTEAECPDTAANLAAVGAPPDAILCKPAETGDKN